VRYTDSNGILSDKEVSKAKQESLFRIAVLGDSIAAGLYQPRSEGFPSILESMLNSGPAPSNRKVEVINFAVNGYRTVQEMRVLETKAIQFSPDLIVLQYCLNDPGNSLTPTVWFEDQGFSGSHVIRRTLKGLRKLVAPVNPSDSHFVPVFGPGYGSTDYWLSLYAKDSASWLSVKRSFQRIADIAHQKGVPAIVLIFPLLIEPEWQISLIHPVHQQVTLAAQEAGLQVLDLLEVFRRFQVKDLQFEKGDIYHPNLTAHRMTAEELYTVVAELLEERLEPAVR